MVHPNTILESLAFSCQHNTVLPDQVSYATVELDGGGEHSDVSLPIVEFRITDIARDGSHNTDRHGVTRAPDGTETGYRYDSWYVMDVVVAVQTASQTSITHRELDQLTRQALFRHDQNGPNKPLPDPNSVSETLNGISWVRVGGTSPEHEFALSPSIRSREIRLEIGFENERTSADLGIEHDVVEDVDVTVTADE